MWWIKATGALLTVGAGTLLGLEVAARWARRPRRVGELRSALALLESEMAVGRTPLPEAAARVAALAPGTEAAGFFHRLAADLKAGAPAAAAWRRAAGTLAGESDRVILLLAPRLHREEAADLEPFALLGGVIGTTGLDDQLKHLALARERLANREREAAAEAARLVPLYRYAGLASGLLLALLLV
ncbi:MAG: stage III sporulation protein AB [Bacillota bacterium]|nr:stage III sporulation protein AB [Bacillota bacterium]